jgi:hypothetical protein
MLSVLLKVRKMTEKMVRASFTMEPEILQKLKFIADKMGISRSACLNQLLGSPLDDLSEMLSDVPDKPTVDDILRARGKSNAMILKRLGHYMNALDGQGDLLDDSNH